MARHLRRQGFSVGRKRIRRLMHKMGLVQKPRTSKPCREHKIYPFLLRDIAIDRLNRVWCADVTYIQIKRGFLYLMAVMDWASRRVLAWRLSNTMDVDFYVAALQEAITRYGASRDLQHQSGLTVHKLCLHRRAEEQWHPHLDGWQGPLDRQRIHRKAVAIAQI